MKNKLFLPAALLFMLALMISQVQAAGEYDLIKQVSGSVGGDMGGNGYQVMQTVGQPLVGQMSGGSFQASIGYWHGKQASVETYPIPLVPDWNLVSRPAQPMDSGIPQVLDSIAGNYHIAYAHESCLADNQADPWRKYDPSAPPYANNLTQIDEKMGFWLNMAITDTLVITGTVPMTPPAISLCAGWNLVGYPTLQEQPVTDALKSIEGQYTIIFAHDRMDRVQPWKKYDPKAPPYVNDLETMKPEWGYWIYANEDVNWKIDNKE